MSDHRDALWSIAHECSQSRTYTRRIQTIHNRAMIALGLTKSQRDERHLLAQEFSANHKARLDKVFNRDKERLTTE